MGRLISLNLLMVESFFRNLIQRVYCAVNVCEIFKGVILGSLLIKEVNLGEFLWSLIFITFFYKYFLFAFLKEKRN